MTQNELFLDGTTPKRRGKTRPLPTVAELATAAAPLPGWTKGRYGFTRRGVGGVDQSSVGSNPSGKWYGYPVMAVDGKNVLGPFPTAPEAMRAVEDVVAAHLKAFPDPLPRLTERTLENSMFRLKDRRDRSRSS